MKTAALFACMLFVATCVGAQQRVASLGQVTTSSSPVELGVVFDDVSFEPIPANRLFTIADNDPPPITKLANGYTVEYSYTLTATAAGAGQPIDTNWVANRPFKVTAEKVPPMYAVHIEGETTMDMSDGRIEFLVSGAVDGGSIEKTFYFPPNPLSGQNVHIKIPWDLTSDAKLLNVGSQYGLHMFSGPVWVPKNAGDTLSFSSTYTITLETKKPGM